MPMKRTSPCPFLCLYLLLLSYPISGQQLDSLQISAGYQLNVATQAYQPLWLLANRHGIIADRQADLLTQIRLANRHDFHERSPAYPYHPRRQKPLPVSLSYGLQVYNHQQFGRTFLQEAYLKLQAGAWQLSIGRTEETIGELNPRLSSGSLGLSGNAPPVPKVSISLRDYVSLPFTADWLQVKGRFSHGWMGKASEVKGALLHERNLYLRIGPERFRLYGGLNRFALWGGKHPDYGQLQADWQAFGTVVFGRPVDDARPYRARDATRLGNHLGFLDMGFYLNLPQVKVSLYRQVPFEDRSGLKPLANPDQLLGITFSHRDAASPWRALSLEYLDTRHQSGNRRSGHDNYYNNRLYGQGWSYQGRNLGTPLFLDRERAALYLQERIAGADRWRIINNRIRALHLGVLLRPLPFLEYRSLITWTENHGNYFNKGQFSSAPQQWYLLQEFVWQAARWRLYTAAGCDLGSLSSNFGLSVGLEYRLKTSGHQFWLPPLAAP